MELLVNSIPSLSPYINNDYIYVQMVQLQVFDCKQSYSTKIFKGNRIIGVWTYKCSKQQYIDMIKLHNKIIGTEKFILQLARTNKQLFIKFMNQFCVEQKLYSDTVDIQINRFGVNLLVKDINTYDIYRECATKSFILFGGILDIIYIDDVFSSIKQIYSSNYINIFLSKILNLSRIQEGFTVEIKSKQKNNTVGVEIKTLLYQSNLTVNTNSIKSKGKTYKLNKITAKESVTVEILNCKDLTISKISSITRVHNCKNILIRQTTPLYISNIYYSQIKLINSDIFFMDKIYDSKIIGDNCNLFKFNNCENTTFQNISIEYDRIGHYSPSIHNLRVLSYILHTHHPNSQSDEIIPDGTYNSIEQIYQTIIMGRGKIDD